MDTTDNFSRKKKRTPKIIENKEPLNNLNLPNDNFDTLFFREQYRVFCVIRKVLTTLMYMYIEKNAKPSEIFTLSIIEDILSKKREFTWGDFLQNYMELNDFVNMSKDDTLELQVAFLTTFTTSTTKITKSKTVMFTPHPYQITLDHPLFFLQEPELVKTIFPNDLKIIINPINLKKDNKSNLLKREKPPIYKKNNLEYRIDRDIS